MTNVNFNVSPITDACRAIVNARIAENWAGPYMVSRGVLHDTRTHKGFVAMAFEEVIGYILYNIGGENLEITMLESLSPKQGIGSALIQAVKSVAKDANCKYLWLITTNDNTPAIRYYQRYGFSLTAVHINSMETARKLKPGIPLNGIDDIPIKHEFEFEILLYSET